MARTGTIVWQAIQWTGLEHFNLTTLTDGFLAEGRLVGVDEDVAYTFQYQIRTDSQWRVLEVIIYTDVVNQVLFHLTADGKGHWYDESGATLPELTGCIDVDLTLTPFTNTLPIRRLQFLPEKSEPIKVVYIELPAGKISPVEQFYTQLAAGTYRFEQPAIDFVAELAVDADGLILDYPDLFRRIT
ncbi:putative glycolipid-binding domain-containing protein [Spirosoma sp. BT702]|uniref:Glycolipid-binding domain-containing protein n=1 Tax=Spirosoma profusum TaxID=2771354 RepID=A0A926XVG9_9BACT|nr:putative glycolipid-binding domain-containing protein [Spirosoma profusum]MBD2701227.1 putative glycolipid-binding domain-containing protein [Spirosoma profusum]